MLNQKEASLIQDLKEQEKLCIQKYMRYADAAHDQELKDLFNMLKENEVNHYEALEALKKDAAKREAREETGCELKNLKYLCSQIHVMECQMQ